MRMGFCHSVVCVLNWKPPLWWDSSYRAIPSNFACNIHVNNWILNLINTLLCKIPYAKSASSAYIFSSISRRKSYTRSAVNCRKFSFNCQVKTQSEPERNNSVHSILHNQHNSKVMLTRTFLEPKIHPNKCLKVDSLQKKKINFLTAGETRNDCTTPTALTAST